MFIIISVISGIISGMGIGGGSVFVMLMTMFNILDHKTAMAYNLIMFIVVGITATINNIKDKKFDKKLFLKIIVFCIIGSFVGVYFTKQVPTDNLKQYFYIFILIIGIYEIISSVISFKKGKI